MIHCTFPGTVSFLHSSSRLDRIHQTSPCLFLLPFQVQVKACRNTVKQMLLYILIGVFKIESFPISHAFENIIFIFFHLLADSPAQLFLIDAFCRFLFSLLHRQLCQQRAQMVFY